MLRWSELCCVADHNIVSRDIPQSLLSLLSTMHTATRGPGRRKQHYSQATFNMHLEAVTTDRRTTVTAHTAATTTTNNNKDRRITLEGDDDEDDDDDDDNDGDNDGRC